MVVWPIGTYFTTNIYIIWSKCKLPNEIVWWCSADSGKNYYLVRSRDQIWDESV